MRVCVLQCEYSDNIADSDILFQKRLTMLDECTQECDIIVLPEYSEVPCSTATDEELTDIHDKFFPLLFEKCTETAQRCKSLLFFNALCNVDGEMRNTTYAINKYGNLVGKYYKTHIPPSERAENVAYEYTHDINSNYILEIDGVRYAFLTCYDFYFYEAFAKIAKNNVDIIIGCSLQRSDTHSATEIICRFLAYNTNAYVLRSSVSYKENATVCGASMIVAPNGDVLANIKGKIGKCFADIDVKSKYYKPAGFGRKPSAHYKYIEEGRSPWQYRPSGSAICLSDNQMPYPRICAHRGFNTVCPENSLPAYGAAVALGADEIEFDIRATKDGELVSAHDSTLERVSDGIGNICDHTYNELLDFDFGIKCGEHFKGLPIVKFEDILKKFACQVIMNIHFKIWDNGFEDPQYERIASLIRKYDCEKHVYIMTANDKCLKEFHDIAPDINRCVGWNGVKDKPLEIVERALKLNCEKVQLFKPYFNQEAIDLAHKNNIKCNVFFADDPVEAVRYLEMGVDTILTNDFLQVSNALKKHCGKLTK